MRIAIPVDKKSDCKKVSISFGRAAYFLIYDLDKEKISYMENPGFTCQQGAGVKAAQFILDTGIQALLSPRCGKNAMEILELAGIKVYKTESLDVKENIDLYKNSKLATIDDLESGFLKGR